MLSGVLTASRGGPRAGTTSKMEHFVITVNGWKPFNYYHKAFHLGCCSSPRSASGQITESVRVKRNISKNQTQPIKMFY